MRTLTLGILCVLGGFSLLFGASHGWWRLTTLGILCLSIALGMIIARRRTPYSLWRFKYLWRISRPFR